MRSIKHRFKQFNTQDNCWSSYICFAVTITGQQFDMRAVRKWFNKLVDKDDYDSKDRLQILFHLEDLTNSTEGCIKKSDISPESAASNK